METKMNRTAKIITIAAMAVMLVMVSWVGARRVSSASAGYNPYMMKSFWAASMPQYPGAKEYPLSDKMTMGNTRVKMSWFKTTDEPLLVAQFYASIWKKKGHYVTEDIQPFGGRVSSIDFKDNLQRQVIMEKKGRHTVVFVSQILGRLMRLSSGDTKPGSAIVPIYPGAEGVISFGSNDVLATSKTISFVDRGTVADNVSYYQKEMAVRGYTLAEKENRKIEALPDVIVGSMKMLIFRRDTEEITVTISPVTGSKRTRVHITKISGKGE